MPTGLISSNGHGSEPAADRSAFPDVPARPHAESTGPERIADTIRLVWAGRFSVLLVTAAVTLVGVVYALVAPPRYESTTRLLPAPTSTILDGATQMMKPEMGALAGLAGLPNLRSGDERFVALLHSRVVADRIIARFNLMTAYGSRYHHEARTALERHTIIQQDRKTGVITITVKDRLPERAARIAQAYVEELEKLNAEMNLSGAHLERKFLDERVKEVDAQLQDAVTRLSAFSTSSKMLDPQTQPKSTVDEALKIEAQIVALKAELRGQEQIYQSEALQVPRARLAELERHLALIQGGNADGSLPSIRSIPKLGATFTNLGRRAKLLEAVQLYLTQKLEIAKTEEVKQLPVFSVMEQAEIPEQRVWPRRTTIVLATFVAGIALGMLLVIGKAKWISTDAAHPMKALLLDFCSPGPGRSDGKVHTRNASV